MNAKVKTGLIAGAAMLAFLIGSACVLAYFVIVHQLTSRPTPASSPTPAGSPLASDPRSTYPAPVSKYNGWNAEHWAEEAADLSHYRHHTACAALSHLGAEGVPFLLRQLKRDAERLGKDAQRTNDTLENLDGLGQLIRTEDLPIIVEFLTAPPDRPSTFPGLPRRLTASNCLRQAGSRARPFMPAIRKVLEEKDLDNDLRTNIKETLAAIN